MPQLGSPFKLCSQGRDSGSFLWKNIGSELVEFSNVLVQIPGGSPEFPRVKPGMAAVRRLTQTGVLLIT